MGAACSGEDNTAPPPSDNKPEEQQPAAAAAESQPAATDEPAAAAAPAADDDDDEEEEADALDEDEDDSDFEECWGRGSAINPKKLINVDEIDADFGIDVQAKGDGDDLFSMEEAADGEQFMAVKPWLGSIVAPSDAPANDASVPDASLELEWVHGYRGFDSRSNLVQAPDGDLIYSQAAVVIKYNPSTHTQTFFRGMTDDVICLAQNPANKNIVACGQVATIVDRRATLPHIGVWNCDTGEEWLLPKAHKRAVRSVSFSPDGKYLASVGQDDKYTVRVWDWAEKKLVAEESSSNNKVFQIRWGNAAAPNSFVTVGTRSFFLFELENGTTLTKKRGIFGKNSPQTFFSACFTPKGMAAVGAKDGSVYIFKGNKCVKRVKDLNKGAIFSIENNGDGLVIGGKGKRAHLVDKTLKVAASIDFDAVVRSVHVAADDTLVVGLQNCAIHTVAQFNSATPQVSAPLVQGHWDGELWAMDVHPTNGEFFTAGEDNSVRRWTIADRKQLSAAVIDETKGGKKKVRRVGTTSAHPTNQSARAVAYSPCGTFVAIGLNNGHLKVYKADSMEEVVDHNLNSFSKRQVNNQNDNWIQAMRYSPDGKALAVGTHASMIVLCNVDNNHEPEGKLTAHNSALTHLDWSADNAHIQSICRGYELLFHNVDTSDLKSAAQNTSPSSVKDVAWATQTCMLGWPVQGVFDTQQDGTDINLCARSPCGTLIATGDDYGNVNLFRYPCLEQGVNKQKVYAGHSSHVQGVHFSPSGDRLFTVGGNDKAIFQWKVVKA